MNSEPASGWSDELFVVALTGGIASGKSAVSRLFDALGVQVVDTDVIARELVEPGKPLLNSIVTAFGHELIDAYGRLKRRKLRKIIIKDDEKRAQLEALMHPKIAVEVSRRLSEIQDSPYCILVVPLLAEKGGYKAADRVLVVDTDRELQIKRVMERDDVSREQAIASLAIQASREERLAIADDIISNRGSLETLAVEVERLHGKYLVLAERHKAMVQTTGQVS
ncbi:MAG: dephospho-CoA kinase [Xanthomonadales bacterium]|nr:dephospho-CoA kinase [Gammaproteobacteria bacterium]NNE06166.1 dephospho-CoA kinase [Xanthomonadales bacterium]NNL95824.1 dephospho-CoA kinase [Xanthomonadales bacterium]